MSSLEERDPAAALTALYEGVAERVEIIRRHEGDIRRRYSEIGYMRETIGMVKARNPDLVPVAVPEGGPDT